MNQIFVERFMKNKHLLKAKFSLVHPDDYGDIVKAVFSVISDSDSYGEPDPDIIHKIDDGDYQGTLLFLIPERCYQPYDYWFVRVSYGSCSSCDTLQGIRDMSGWGDEKPNEEQVKEYMSLALHIVQGIKKLGGDE